MQLKEALDHHKVHAEEERARRVWRQNCRRLEALDATLVEKGKLFDNLNHEITMGAVIREQQADVEEQRQEALNYAEYPHSEHSNFSLVNGWTFEHQFRLLGTTVTLTPFSFSPARLLVPALVCGSVQ